MNIANLEKRYSLESIVFFAYEAQKHSFMIILQ